ncbi:MAG: SRPBCC family protein [Flavobacteriales bacterium]|nr:MAG: SRPBCC family protein [Flavobacteriales bacterium]
MSNLGTYTSTDTVRFERILPGPIERVWSYLIEPEKRAKWLASGPLEPRVGGAARLTWLHSNLDAQQEPVPEEFKRYENGHSMDATVTRCDPPRLLGFTWGADPARLSEVIIELNEQGNDILLVLTHERLPSKNDLLGVSGGWHTHLDILVAHLNGSTAPGFWSAHIEARKKYQAQIGTEQQS